MLDMIVYWIIPLLAVLFVMIYWGAGIAVYFDPKLAAILL